MHATDVTIDGVGYMVAPGSYVRTQDGIAEGRTGRVVMRDFFGGQRRALQLERDRGWDAAGVGPAYAGQGVEPWPYQTAYTDAALAPLTTLRAPSLVVGDYAFLAVGRFLYRSPALAAASWADFIQVADVGAGKTITRLVAYRGDLLLCCGTGLDVQRFTYPAGPLATFSAGLMARIGIGYARQLIYADPVSGNEDVLKMTTGAGPDSRELDAPIVNMGIYDGRVAIATRQSLWLLGGRPDPTTNLWSQEPVPFFTQGVWNGDDDFCFLLEFGGRLYTWLANQVVVWEAAGQRQGWRAAGLEGHRCFGATVAGNMLVVCCTTRNGLSETWAFDGSGWWLLVRAATQPRVWPMHLAGAGGYDLAAFRDGSTGVTYDLFRMVWRSPLQQTYPPTATYLTSLLDAGERDRPKAWRALGATFAIPEERGNQASDDPVTVALAFSIDGGRTFVQVASASPSDPAQRVLTLSGEPELPAIGAWIQLRVTWTSVLDWAPVLTGLWAEYELLDAPARRRRWRFKIHARDATVQRDGSITPRSGRQLSADLWAAWESGATLPFEDIDAGTTATTYQVRIIGISEEIARPVDAPHWGDSVIALTLVEV